MDWFELSVRMPEDAKCQNLAARLKNPLAFGYVVKIYAHCYLHETDTFSGPAAISAIEQAAGWRGKAGRLVDLLLEPDVAILEKEGSTFTVHAVGKRLAAALKRRTDAAARKQRQRGKGDAPGDHGMEPPVTRDGTRDSSVTSRGSSGYHNQPDRTGPDPCGQPASTFTGDRGTTERLAGSAFDLSGLCRRIGEAFQHDRPLGVGLEPDRVTASFGRWIARLGEEATAAECVRIARERGVDPHHLSWFPGWLDTVPTWRLEQLRQARHRRNGTPETPPP